MHKSLFLRVLGADVLGHFITEFNAHNDLSRAPKNELTEAHFLKYLGMHFAFQFNTHQHILKWFGREFKRTGFLGKHRFFWIHQHRRYDPHVVSLLLKDSFASLCKSGVTRMTCSAMGNFHCLDEFKSPWNARHPLVTHTPHKPHSKGIDFWMVCQCTMNNRPYCLSFLPWLTVNGDYSHERLARALLGPFFDQPEGHLTADAWYDSHALRSLISNAPDHYYTLSRHTGCQRDLWDVLHTELDALQDADAYVTYHNTDKNEIATVMMDKKVVNTRSTFFTPNTTVTGEDLSPITSPLVTNYKETFNAVDAFNKLFYSCYWCRRQCRWMDNIFDKLIQLTAVNAYSIYTKVHNCNELILTVWLEQLIDELLSNYEWLNV